MDAVFILTFSWHSLLWIPGPALFKVLYQTAEVLLCIISVCFPDCPCVLVTPLAFKVKAIDYLQLHKYLIVECVTWGTTVRYDFFCLNLSESTESQHDWSPGYTGPMLHQGCDVHSYSQQHLDRMEQGSSRPFLCGNSCFKQENVPRGVRAARSDSWQKNHRHGRLNSVVLQQHGDLQMKV